MELIKKRKIARYNTDLNFKKFKQIKSILHRKIKKIYETIIQNYPTLQIEKYIEKKFLQKLNACTFNHDEIINAKKEIKDVLEQAGAAKTEYEANKINNQNEIDNLSIEWNISVKEEYNAENEEINQQTTEPPVSKKQKQI